VITTQGTGEREWQALQAAIRRDPQAQLVTVEDHYLHAEFTSLIFRFVDDVEFLHDPASSQIHVRSASRIGHSDLGVNRARIEKLRRGIASALE
jgi:uncharacterized protein (DUF1499 family)